MEQDKAKVDFFNLERIPVTLTYQFTEPATVITFFCKLALAADDIDARQKFYAQPLGDQEKGKHAYNVDLLCRITAAMPEGLPGFNEQFLKRENPPSPITLKFIIDELRAFLSEPTPMKIKVADDAIDRYNRIAMPAEFFR